MNQTALRVTAFMAFAVVAVGNAAPRIELIGPDLITNECHSPFVDPGVRVTDAPVAVAAGGAHSLALKADGVVVGWGFSANGEVNIPVDATNIVAIAAGEGHSVGLRADGSVLAWGGNSSGRTNVPFRATNIINIAAGELHSLALGTDGSVLGWGWGYYGQTNVPENATNIVGIAGGIYRSLALKSDRTIIAWGRDVFGENVVPINATNVVAIASGWYHSLALKEDGTLIAWGAGTKNTGSFPEYGQAIIPIDATNVVAISASYFHNVALKADGSVVAWGLNYHDQSNAPANVTNAIAVAAGYYHSLAILANGSVVGWGNNVNGETTIPAGLSWLGVPVTVTGSVNTEAVGTYTLTYTATNILGEVGVATRTVVVADRTPPEMVCPTNAIAELTSTAGVRVSFAAQATDLCAGELPVICVPPSDSTFPIGANIVLCAATDNSGNSVQCSFTVKVMGARGVKASILSEMLEIESQLPGNRLLNTAIASLARSIAQELWVSEVRLNPSNGSKVFIAEAHAVRLLQTLLDQTRNGIAVATLLDWMVRLANIDRILAVAGIEVAVNAGAPLADLAKSRSILAKGDEAAADQNYSIAILYYEHAWREAMRQTGRFPELQ